MKLQPALIFGENMVLQREKNIPVWGRSVNNDVVTVTLNGNKKQATAEDGIWCVVFEPMQAMNRTSLTISSEITGEKISFENVSVGEVWLAGGQSNMEFLLKYDICAQEMYATDEDAQLRYFRYPQASFLGNLERDTFPDDGFWRTWSGEENISFFSAPAAYMGRELRKKLNVPIGFIGCNWGGTPAVAWADMDDIKQNPALQPILDWQQNACKELDWQKYEQDALKPTGKPTAEQLEIQNTLMMGGDPKEIFAKHPFKIPEGYSPFVAGPKAAIRPAGLYENIMKKIAPYAVRGAVWYQGEDDDARGWESFYDESMKTTIKSWRKLWNEELPFFQVELAPLDEGMGKALNYAIIRSKQRAAADVMSGVHNVCIMDAGDKHNIHVRNKKPVGERLALLARKYVYGETSIAADSPRAQKAVKTGGTVTVYFNNAENGLVIKHNQNEALDVSADEKAVTPAAKIQGSTLVLEAPELATAKSITIRYDEENYCEASIFSTEGLPAFPFTLSVQE